MFNHWRKIDSEVEHCLIQEGKKLLNATLLNDLVQVAELLNKGVLPDTPDYNRSLYYDSKEYITPLHCAAREGFTKCVKLLISYGADVNSKDRFDVTPLHLAAYGGHLKCLNLLLENDADCNAAIQQSQRGKYKFSLPFTGGSTPLHLAATKCHSECIQELIRYAADYNAIDEAGLTSMHIAAQQSSEECVNTHLDNAIGRYILSFPGGEIGDTPLHTCLTNKLFTCIPRLIKLGSDVHHKNRYLSSPMDIIMEQLVLRPRYYDNARRYLRILQDILENGYNVDVSSKSLKSGCSPLQFLIKKGIGENMDTDIRTAVSLLLLAYGADFHVKTSLGTYFAWELMQSKFTLDKKIVYAIINSQAQPPKLSAIEGLSQDPVDIIDLEWYNEIAQEVSPLQHLARHTIRTVMGPKRLRYIGSLDIPVSLKEYLFLDVATVIRQDWSGC